MRVVIYLRVSTPSQAESEAGLRAQEDACRAFATRAGAEVVGPFADKGISGAKPLDQRPALAEALTQIGRGDTLLVAKRDRLGRDPIIVAMIEKAVRDDGGTVVSAAGEGTDDDSPASILMRRVIDGVSEYERLINRVRTCAALAAKRKRGQRTGSVPFGFALADDGERSKTDRPLGLVPDPRDHAAAAEAHRLRGEGWTLQRIGDELGRQGYATKKGGKRWSHVSVRKLLLRLGPAATAEPTTESSHP